MDEDTIVQPNESSSQTLSETTIADEDSVKSIQSSLESILDGSENTVEDIKNPV